VTVSVSRRGDDVSIAVEDQGFGIPSRERQSVFHNFMRGSDSARRGNTCMGLGLALPLEPGRRCRRLHPFGE
jgi:signal transduction histidine kinase